MAQHNVTKAKAIHAQAQQVRNARVAELKTAAQPLRGFVAPAPRPNVKPRKGR
ncbi:hypothetical protein ACK30A_15860 [Aeromonas caviae]